MRTHEVTNALVTLSSLHKPGALYNATKALDLQDVPAMAKCDPDAMLWQEQPLKTQAARPNLTPVLNKTGHQYRGSRECPYLTKVKSKCTSTTTWR